MNYSINQKKAPPCHRFLVGGAAAERQAIWEHSGGWDTGHIDPSLPPSEYHWSVDGDDVLVHAVDSITQGYAQTLGLMLMAKGARIVAIFDCDGRALFGRFPEMDQREAG